MQIKKFFKYWGPVGVWLLVIFSLSSIPTLPSPKIIWWDFVLKKFAHIIEYAILYLLLFRAIKFQIPNIKNKKLFFIIPFLFSLAYAISDEIHQSFVPGRHCKLMDIGFDTLGMILMARFLVNKFFNLSEIGDKGGEK